MSSIASEPSQFSLRLQKTVGKLAESKGVRTLLLYGAEGAGQEDAARLLAATWLDVDQSNLNRCVDFQQIDPWGPSRFLKIEAIKEVGLERRDKTNPFLGIPILTFFRTKPLMQPTKCVVLTDVDRMTPAAANSLLKTLEELPDYARAILTSHNMGQVLATIRSRCLCVSVESPPLPELFPNLTLTDAQLTFIETSGEMARYGRSPEPIEGFYAMLESLRSMGPGIALKASEKTREFANELAMTHKVPNREAQAWVLEMLARWVQKNFASSPQFGILIAEAHRLIQGNVNASMVFDEVFAKLLVGSGNFD